MSKAIVQKKHCTKSPHFAKIKNRKGQRLTDRVERACPWDSTLRERRGYAAKAVEAIWKMDIQFWKRAEVYNSRAGWGLKAAAGKEILLWMK